MNVTTSLYLLCFHDYLVSSVVLYIVVVVVIVVVMVTVDDVTIGGEGYNIYSSKE